MENCNTATGNRCTIQTRDIIENISLISILTTIYLTPKSKLFIKKSFSDSIALVLAQRMCQGLRISDKAVEPTLFKKPQKRNCWVEFYVYTSIN